MAEKPTKEGMLQSLRNWGGSPYHDVPPVLLFTSYLNLSGYETDAAGITAAWSGRMRFWRCGGRRKKLSVRGVVRGASLGLCAVNVAGCGLAYVSDERKGGPTNKV
ncbi:hypothetical protein BCR34DRAFT_569132 [Clohesyomyces aquaticus]|uniref:Uncharacterized protein n=1 Tax=Clohesyomyces aquaticus TaxID=1231657 RepID=A0A1Y1ZGF6_9PLEO|nr:hypothetical protein BCR34DRAFT_569132 [Clohesyomyces aquaticus]